MLIGVDGGADALLEMGLKPDIIIGDFDSVQRAGAALRGHARRARLPRRAWPRARPASDALGPRLRACSRRPAPARTSRMLLAYEKGAELIVAVGTHTSMEEFLDKGRERHGVDVPRAPEGRAASWSTPRA